ncbi:Squalene--hopene cyclase [Planctomycetales bacterium]|nr:Squalene--hopene cyclase [Planctomycetales bacterium]
MDAYLYNMDREQQEKTNRQETTSRGLLPPVDDLFEQQLRRGISATRQFFFTHQHPDGYWVAELEGDALLQSETIMLLAFLGEEETELAKACAVQLLDTQLDDGGWGMYTGGKSDVNNTVKAYFALKLTGHDPSADYMQRARVRALELGGVDQVNSFTRFYLAVLGQIPHDACPAVPPQMMLFPDWSPINIYSMSAWSRTIFVPLSIVSALAPVRALPPERGIKEIFVKHPSQWGPLVAPGKKLTRNPFSWDKFFRFCNSVMWFCRRFGLTPLRKLGIEKAKQWTLEHCRFSDGPGAIYPPIVWAWIAFKTLGYADDSEEIQYFRKQLNDLVIRNEKRGSVRIQPCKSPVWDTALTLKALMLGGLTATHPAVRKGVQWVRSRHIGGQWGVGSGEWRVGDTSGKDSKYTALSTNTNNFSPLPPGAWCFEFNNAFYPDCDDTAMALMVLAGRFDEARTGGLPPDLRLTVGESAESMDEAKQNILDVADTSAALDSGLRWLLAMQNKDGGWGAFDKDNNKEFLCKVPFADHNAMIDPSTPDLTGRVMESLGRLGFRLGLNPEIDKVVAYMKKEQQADGSWFGRWGVNYIYGTWQALTGLSAVGVSADDPAIIAGANWLLAHQHPGGGWGESPDSYQDPSLRGRGNPTASQTAWAVMGLIAAGRIDDPAVQRGIRFLLDRQRDDGTWYEPEFTGTGFPLVFYLKYHYYSVYFPLMAMSLYASKMKVANVSTCEEETILRLQKIRIFSPETDYYNNARPNDPAEQPHKVLARKDEMLAVFG